MPIGGVAAYRDQVSVVGLGFDIACGNASVVHELTPLIVVMAGAEELDPYKD